MKYNLYKNVCFFNNAKHDMETRIIYFKYLF